MSGPNKTVTAVDIYSETLTHASYCIDARCSYAKCCQFKRVIAHSRTCMQFKKHSCSYCRQLLSLCIYHAKRCNVSHCQTPFCTSIKLKLESSKAPDSFAGDVKTNHQTDEVAHKLNSTFQSNSVNCDMEMIEKLLNSLDI